MNEHREIRILNQIVVVAIEQLAAAFNALLMT